MDLIGIGWEGVDSIGTSDELVGTL